MVSLDFLLYTYNIFGIGFVTAMALLEVALYWRRSR
jgi:hypothetical protein